MAENRVNPNNEAARDSYRPDKASFDRGGRILSPTRVDRSPFQKLLDKMEENTWQGDFSSSTPPPFGSSDTQSAVRPVLSYQERFGREKDDLQKKMTEKDPDREEGRSTVSKESGIGRTKEADRRVVARSSVSGRKDQGGGGQGGSKEGGFGQGRRGRAFTRLLEMLEMKGTRRGPGGKLGGIQSRFEAEMARAGATRTKAASPERFHKNHPLSKLLLDQIAQYCRLVTKTDGDKEIDMQLHEEVFKGLRLRVSTVQGKMEVTFLTGSQEVQGLFQARKGEIREALAEKGIDVRSINVIMV